MYSNIKSFIIIGRTKDDHKFRPSDWADRLCGTMSIFSEDNRTTYSEYVLPSCTLKGDKSVIVDSKLYQENPLAFNFLMGFAKDNNLKVEFLEKENYKSEA